MQDLNVSLIEVEAHVRYWEDSDINGEPDVDVYETGKRPQMPCSVRIFDLDEIPFEKAVNKNRNYKSEDFAWCPIIDVETGEIINWYGQKNAFIHYKVCDEFYCSFINNSGERLFEYNGYVPNFMCIGDDGYGDYIIMEINADEQGKAIIKNWTTEALPKLKKFLETKLI